ncbi:MAG: hypothetical protein IJE89_04720 [Bacilli bacterium]|nr:hypothetical protein [Bacilli bacterium]
MNQEKKKITKVNTRIIITIILLLIVIISGTFAWFTYSSKKSALVLTVGDIDSTRITLYPYEFTGTLDPVNSYDSVSYTQITAINNNSTSSSFELSYNAEQIPEELSSSSVKYTITKRISEDTGYEFYSDGDLSELTPETPIILLEKENLDPESTTYYRVYLWLDNNSGDHSNLQGKTLSVNLNVKLNGIDTEETPEIVQINANKFSCEGDRRLAVYYVTSCSGNDCSYSTKNGLDSSYDFSLDIFGIPTWTLDKNSYSDSLSDVGGNCTRETWYVNTSSSNLYCRQGASTSATAKTKFSKCTPIYVYRTTMKIDDTHNWFYSSTYGCYLYGEYLSSSKPSSCTSGSDSGTSITGTCVCNKSDGSKINVSCSTNDLRNSMYCSYYCTLNYYDMNSSTCAES